MEWKQSGNGKEMKWKERETNDISYKPIDITADILKEKWFLEELEEEFTIMKIIVKNNNQKIEIELYDEYDKNNQITSKHLDRRKTTVEPGSLSIVSRAGRRHILEVAVGLARFSLPRPRCGDFPCVDDHL